MLLYCVLNKTLKASEPGLLHCSTKVYKLRLCKVRCNVSHVLLSGIARPARG